MVLQEKPGNQGRLYEPAGNRRWLIKQFSKPLAKQRTDTRRFCQESAWPRAGLLLSDLFATLRGNTETCLLVRRDLPLPHLAQRRRLPGQSLDLPILIPIHLILPRSSRNFDRTTANVPVSKASGIFIRLTKQTLSRHGGTQKPNSVNRASLGTKGDVLEGWEPRSPTVSIGCEVLLLRNFLNLDSLSSSWPRS